jgi:hypothetical protein
MEACGLALRAEALRPARRLFEPFDKTQDKLREFVCAPTNLASVHLVWPGRASLVLAPFAQTKGARLSGRNPTFI